MGQRCRGGAGQASTQGHCTQTRESLALAIAADIAGLLATGQLVRAVSLKAQLQGDALTIDQSVELERHLGEIA